MNLTKKVIRAWSKTDCGEPTIGKTLLKYPKDFVEFKDNSDEFKNKTFTVDELKASGDVKEFFKSFLSKPE